jgi:hypothetical protein
MSVNLIRVVNQQTLVRSILIDKIDRSQGNFETGIPYAQAPKQKIYVPYVNPLDTAVKGYIDLIPTDDVLLSADSGTIKRLADVGRVTKAVVASSLLTTPVITSASHGGSDTTINGTTFLSVTPDVTYVIFTNLVGATQKVASGLFGSFTNILAVVPDSAITIGTPAAGWKVQVQANSKLSNQFTL